MGDYSKIECKIILKKKYVKEISKLYKYPRSSDSAITLMDLKGSIFKKGMQNRKSKYDTVR